MISNKYLITLVAFIALMLFIDHNDIFVQLNRQRQLDKLLLSKQFYEKQIEETRHNIFDLQNNPLALEKYAREKYLWKKDNEDIFVFPSEKNDSTKQ